MRSVDGRCKHMDVNWGEWLEALTQFAHSCGANRENWLSLPFPLESAIEIEAVSKSDPAVHLKGVTRWKTKQFNRGGSIPEEEA